MIKRLVINIVLVGSCTMACADVVVLDNAELDSVVVETQQEQLQPIMPDYNVNGQIGGVVGTVSNPVVGVVAPVANLNVNPAQPPLSPQLISTLNQILNLALQNK